MIWQIFIFVVLTMFSMSMTVFCWFISLDNLKRERDMWWTIMSICGIWNLVCVVMNVKAIARIVSK